VIVTEMRSENSEISSKIKIAVLMGGIGSERDISLESGACVAMAIRNAGLEVLEIDITPDNLDLLDEAQADVFFPVLHGKFGEDGKLQAVLEQKSLVYAGSGPRASELAMDKMASKKLFAKAGVAVPRAIEVRAETKIEEELKVFDGRKFVVKPITEGSSVGVEIVEGKIGVEAAAKKCLERFGDCMIEEFIEGREITVGVVCGQTLPILEIKSKTGFYDFNAKYVDDSTEYLFGTIKGEKLIDEINTSAIKCFDILGCRHFSRVDFILGADNIAYALEVNTIPGFTSHSLLPKAGAKASMPMSDLCVKIINAALKEKLGTAS